MKILRILALSTLFLLANCAPIQRPNTPPGWSLAPSTTSALGLTVVGVSHPSISERVARESALESALGEFLRHCGVEVTSYIKMISRETATGNRPSQVTMNNIDTTTLATQGFVQKVQQQAWHLDRTKSGQWVAYIQVMIPISEMERVQAEQKAVHEAKTAPLRAARASFSTAIQQHRLATATQMIPDLIRLSETSGSSLSREQLVAQIQDGLLIQPCDPPRFNLDRDTRAVLEMCATHNGQSVAEFPLTVTLPSGKEIRAVTEANGRASMTLPSPSHPGTYLLSASPSINSISSTISSFSYQVNGKNRTLSNGQFHNFIETQATSSPESHDTNRHQAEQVALQTARQLAFARLVEMRRGLNVTTKATIRGQNLVDFTVTSEAYDHIQPQVVEERVDWKDSRPFASVIYRLDLHPRSQL